MNESRGARGPDVSEQDADDIERYLDRLEDHPGGEARGRWEYMVWGVVRPNTDNARVTHINGRTAAQFGLALRRVRAGGIKGGSWCRRSRWASDGVPLFFRRQLVED